MMLWRHRANSREVTPIQVTVIGPSNYEDYDWDVRNEGCGSELCVYAEELTPVSAQVGTFPFLNPGPGRV